MRNLLLVTAMLTAGCSGMQRGADWPTLAPRPGEISPMVPRTPLGACAGCGQDVFAAPAAPPVAPPTAPALLPAPADTAARLNAIAAAIAAVETSIPGQRRTADAAIAAASGKADDSNAATEAEVQRSRLEALYLPLAVEASALDDVEDAITGKADTAALVARIASLRGRLAKLEADRLN